MTFEDAINSLGSEFGAELEIEDGVAALTAHDDDGDEIDVILRSVENNEYADISSDLGELPSEGSEELMLKMLEANHLFSGTGGATLSIEEGRAKLERRVPLTELGRGEGAPVLTHFLATARKWRAALANR